MPYRAELFQAQEVRQSYEFALCGLNQQDHEGLSGVFYCPRKQVAYSLGKLVCLQLSEHQDTHQYHLHLW